MSESEIRTKYSDREDNEFYSLFSDESWADLQVDERLELLQELECRMAVSEGRSPVKVVAEPLGGINKHGRFDSVEGLIKINSLLLQTKKIPGMTDGKNMVEALDTIIHEGRHAFQYAVVSGATDGANVADDDREKWTVNFILYSRTKEDSNDYESNEEYFKDFSFYAFQPIERDAREFAGRKMAELYQKVKEATGREQAVFQTGMKNLAENKCSEFEIVRSNLSEKDIEERTDRFAAELAKVIDLDNMNDADVLKMVLNYGAGWKQQYVREVVRRQFFDLEAIVNQTKHLGRFIDGLEGFLERPELMDAAGEKEDFDAASIMIKEQDGRSIRVDGFRRFYNG